MRTLDVVLAAERGEEAPLLAWLAGGGRVDATYERGGVSGITLLMFAAIHGHERMVELLLQRGAEANLQNSKGDTALMLAAAVLQVDLSAAPYQQVDHPLVALDGGAHQQRDAAPLASLVRRVDPPADVEPRQQRLLVASLSCCEDLIGDCRGTARSPLRRRR